jgi:predicted dehydrogenase
MGGREVRKGPDHGQIFDHHFVEFTYPDGQVVASQCRHQPGCMNRIDEVFQGSRGSVHVHSGNYGVIQSKRGREIYNHVDENDINPYQQEHNELFAAIKAGKHLFTDFERGVNSTMTAILGRMASYSGQEITWEEALASNLKLVPENLRSFKDTAPVLPDEEGNYPVPVPGVTRFI